ncbi:hypothetical protein BE221DRAFT_194722 [Ostreococcus tauri]|uniref:Uncharacterized protein n=1 Tax=Ostreococcus tauri TaxID=70448 RepID=A0A1Y5I1B9_OSTTA|nr:hypothetical protein BE221DRAFT_194722 [Ostreococcus tauri]
MFARSTASSSLATPRFSAQRARARARSSKPRTNTHRVVRVAASSDRARDLARRDAIAFGLASITLAARSARAGDDDSYASKLSAKERRKAEILAQAKEKARAQAATPAAPSAELQSAETFRTENPGRGGGSDAPWTGEQ